MSEDQKEDFVTDYNNRKNADMQRYAEDLDKQMRRNAELGLPIYGHIQTLSYPQEAAKNVQKVWKQRGFAVAAFLKTEAHNDTAVVRYEVTTIAEPQGTPIHFFSENNEWRLMESEDRCITINKKIM